MEAEKRRGENPPCSIFRILRSFQTVCLHKIIYRFLCIFWPARFGTLNRRLGLHVPAQPRPSNSGQDFAMYVVGIVSFSERKKNHVRHALAFCLKELERLARTKLLCHLRRLFPKVNLAPMDSGEMVPKVNRCPSEWGIPVKMEELLRREMRIPS